MLVPVKKGPFMWEQLDRVMRRQLYIVLGLGLLYGCVLGAQFYVARLVHQLNGSATVAGLLLVMSLLPVLLVALYGRRIAARWSLRQQFSVGLVCHAVQMVLLAWSPHLMVLIPALLLSGFGYALCLGPLLTSATNTAPKTHYAQAIAFISLASQLGIGTSSMIASIVEPQFGTRGVFWLPLALALVGLCFCRYLPHARAKAAGADTSAEAAAPVHRPRPTGSLVEVFILMAALGLTFGLPLQFVPMWLGASHEMSFSPGYFLTTTFFTIMMTRVLFSHWLNGEREQHVVMTCFTVVAIAIAVLGFAHSPLQFALCAIPYGAAYSLLYPSCMAYLIKQVDEADRGERSNWALLGYEIGTRCLPFLFGIIADQGGFPLTFQVLAILIAAAGVWHILKRFNLWRSASAVPLAD
jgi:MFS family permease